MRAPGGITLPDAAVCAIALTITLCCCGCDAADVYRAERGLHVQAAANAATSTPKDTFQLIDCRSDNNCKTVPNTSCGKDPLDNQMRCLCSDLTHPINDVCITTPQELGMPCEIETQCSPSADCMHNDNNSKTCQCAEGTADDDNDGVCSGGVRAMLSIYLAVLVAVAVMRNNRNLTA